MEFGNYSYGNRKLFLWNNNVHYSNRNRKLFLWNNNVHYSYGNRLKVSHPHYGQSPFHVKPAAELDIANSYGI